MPNINYDTIGLDRNFLIIYAQAKDFQHLWTNYCDYIDDISENPIFENAIYPQQGRLKEQDSGRFENLKIALTKYKTPTKKIEIYHLFINMYVG